MTEQERQARVERLRDRIGEAGACNDGSCGCKRGAAEAREELAEMGVSEW